MQHMHGVQHEFTITCERPHPLRTDREAVTFPQLAAKTFVMLTVPVSRVRRRVYFCASEMVVSGSRTAAY
jgi:hypothetical protein